MVCIFKLINYLFLAVLSLRCYWWSFPSCSKPGLLSVVVCRLLIAVTSLAAEHWLISCNSWALECRLSSWG